MVMSSNTHAFYFFRISDINTVQALELGHESKNLDWGEEANLSCLDLEIISESVNICCVERSYHTNQTPRDEHEIQDGGVIDSDSLMLGHKLRRYKIWSFLFE